MGYTPEEGVKRLHEAVDDLASVIDHTSGWPPYLQEHLAEQLAALAGGAEWVAHALHDRPLYNEPIESQPLGEHYVATATPSPRRRLLWRVHPRSMLAKSLYMQRGPETLSETDVVAYLDTDDPEVIEHTLRAVEAVHLALGYVDAELVEEIRGSIWRAWRVKLKNGLTSDHVADRLAKVERALDLGFLDVKQAQVDSQEAQAVATLLQALETQERACIRIGSILLIKYTTPSAGGVVLSRNLTPAEMTALQRYPAIQRNPETVLEQLATAVYELNTTDQQAPG
jgi:hypothetical protein